MTLRAAVPADAAPMMAIYNEAIVDHVHANCDVLQSDVGRFGAGFFVDFFAARRAPASTIAFSIAFTRPPFGWRDLLAD